jgi:hypothetical protein
LHPSRRREPSPTVTLRLQPCERTAKENSTTGFKGIHWEDVLLQVHLTRAVLHSYTVSRHAIPAITGTAHIWEKLVTHHAASSVTTENSKKRSVSIGSTV